MKDPVFNLPAGAGSAAAAVALGLGLLLTPAAAGNAAPPAAQAPDGGAAADAAAERAPGDDLLAALRKALDDLSILREELATARRENLELRSTQAEDAITITALKAELAQARGEVERLQTELEESWRWTDELNAVIADLRAARDEAERALAAATRGGDGGGAVQTAARAEPQPQQAEPTATEPAPQAEPARRAEAEPQAEPTPAEPRAIEAAVAERLLATLGGRRPAAEREPVGDDGARSAAPAAAPATSAADGYPAAAAAAVNLREEPENDADVVTVVGKGHVVRVVAENGGWRRVEYTDPLSREFSGWVYGRFLDRAEAERNHAKAALPRDEG